MEKLILTFDYNILNKLISLGTFGTFAKISILYYTQDEVFLLLSRFDFLSINFNPTNLSLLLLLTQNSSFSSLTGTKLFSSSPSSPIFPNSSFYLLLAQNSLRYLLTPLILAQNSLLRLLLFQNSFLSFPTRLKLNIN